MNDIHCKEVSEISGVFSEVRGDGWMYATLEPAGMCPVMSKKQGLKKQRCSLQTWILQQLSICVTNSAPQSLDLGQMLTCWRME